MCRVAAAELSEVFVSKSNREALQRALSRGNTLMVTAVEVDFAFAPGRSVSATCHAVLSAATLWRSLSRCSLHVNVQRISSTISTLIHPAPAMPLCTRALPPTTGARLLHVSLCRPGHMLPTALLHCILLSACRALSHKLSCPKSAATGVRETLCACEQRRWQVR